MSSVTGIELGPDYCVLVKARTRGRGIQIDAVRVFEPSEWPDTAAARAGVLEQVRLDLGFPRRAWLVSWNLPAQPGDAGDDAPSAPGDVLVAQAGFRVEAILAPVQALALLAASRSSRPGDPHTALWLSINQQGAALAVVQGLETLYARELAWRITAPAQRAQAHLLRRYLIAAQLIPEIRRATASVREQCGTRIANAVATGTIGDLRSLTMPLVSGLDIELEPLDAPAGLAAAPAASAAVARSAPALRLAWIAAAAAASHARDDVHKRWLGAAAAVLAVGVAWWALAFWSDATRTAVFTAPPSSSPRAPQSDSSLPGSDPPAQLPVPDPSGSDMARATSGLGEPDPARASAALALLDGPLPTVAGILVSAERRYALVDGSVVREGDRIGQRVVARIETNGVILREPSGLEVRLPVERAGNGSGAARIR